MPGLPVITESLSSFDIADYALEVGERQEAYREAVQAFVSSRAARITTAPTPEQQFQDALDRITTNGLQAAQVVVRPQAVVTARAAAAHSSSWVGGVGRMIANFESSRDSFWQGLHPNGMTERQEWELSIGSFLLGGRGVRFSAREPAGGGVGGARELPPPNLMRPGHPQFVGPLQRSGGPVPARDFSRGTLWREPGYGYGEPLPVPEWMLGLGGPGAGQRTRVFRGNPDPAVNSNTTLIEVLPDGSLWYHEVVHVSGSGWRVVKRGGYMTGLQPGEHIVWDTELVPPRPGSPADPASGIGTPAPFQTPSGVRPVPSTQGGSGPPPQGSSLGMPVDPSGAKLAWSGGRGGQKEVNPALAASYFPDGGGSAGGGGDPGII